MPQHVQSPIPTHTTTTTATTTHPLPLLCKRSTPVSFPPAHGKLIHSPSSEQACSRFSLHLACSRFSLHLEHAIMKFGPKLLTHLQAGASQQELEPVARLAFPVRGSEVICDTTPLAIHVRFSLPHCAQSTSAADDEFGREGVSASTLYALLGIAKPFGNAPTWPVPIDCRATFEKIATLIHTHHHHHHHHHHHTTQSRAWIWLAILS
jgi:hypothetical protein